MRKNVHLSRILTVSAMLITTGLLTADARAQVTVDAITDVWIREQAGSTGTTFESDLVSVWSAASADGARRYGLVEFDVSQFAGNTLQGATLKLYSILGGSSGSSLPIKQSAFIIQPSTTPASSMTWDAYQAEIAGTETALTGLGAYDLPDVDSTPAIQNAFVDSTASAGDLTAIQVDVDGDGILSLVMIADEDGTDYRQDWGDGVLGGLVAQLVVDDGTCIILTDSLPDGIQDTPYSEQVNEGINCTGTLMWSISAGALPTGLNINTSTGEISGTPTAVGLFNFTVQLMSNEGTTTKELSININSPCEIATTSLPDGLEGDPYTAQLQDNGNCTGISWSVISGSLPTGLSLNGATGEITGTPETVGTFNFTVEMVANEATRTQALSINVLSFSGLITIAAGTDVWIREVGPDTTFEDDLISVWSSFTVGNPDTGFRRYGLVEFDLSSLAGKTLVSAELQLFSILGGSSGSTVPIKQTTSLVQPSTTPISSMTWNLYQAELAGTETTFNTFGFYDLPDVDSTPAIQNVYVPSSADGADLTTLQNEVDGDGVLSLVMIADEDGTDYRQDWGDGVLGGQVPLLVVDDGTSCFIDTTSLADGEVGVGYSQFVTTTGPCTGTLSWSTENGFLPDGLSINSATGEISGTPTLTGTFPFTARVDSTDGFFRRKDLSITVTGGANGQFPASGDTWIRESAPDTTFENDLVSVWSTASNDGAGGSPSARRGLIEFDVSSLAGATLVGARLSLFATRGSEPLKQSVAEFTTGAAVGTFTWNSWNTHVSGSGGTTPFSRFGKYDLVAGEGFFTYVDSQPADAADLAQIEAAAGGDGVLSLVLIADEDGTDYRQDWGDEFNSVPPLLIVDIGGGCVILTASLPNPTFGQFYSETLQVSPACGAPTWEIRDCFLPPGLSLNPATGEISGIPGLAGTFEFTAGLVSLANEATYTVTIDPSEADLDEDGDVDGDDEVLFNAGFTGIGGCDLTGAPPSSLVELTATGDVWVRENSPDSVFENDWMSVWSTPSGDRRYGVVEFDVSSLAGETLSSAELSLWVGDSFSGTGFPVKQSAFVIDTSGGTDVFNMTWNTLLTEHPALGTALESLGAYDQGVPNVLGIAGTFQDSDSASAADLTLIENVANTTGTLTIVMVADEDGTEYRGDWGDGANAGGGGFGPDTPGILRVVKAGPPCDITTLTLPDSTVGALYSETLLTDGNCTGTITWSVSLCDLPPGLSLNSSTGEISGTPTIGGSYSFVVDLTANEGTRSRTLTIDVGGPNADFDDDNDVDLVDLDFFALQFGGPFTQTLCGTVSFPATDTPLAIPDGGTVSSTVTVPSTATIADVNVFVDITHPEILDLEIILESPTGTMVTLENFDDFDSGAYTARTYDDEGGTPPNPGPLSNFDTEDAVGTWTLHVSDFSAIPADNGTLNGWTLILNVP